MRNLYLQLEMADSVDEPHLELSHPIQGNNYVPPWLKLIKSIEFWHNPPL